LTPAGTRAYRLTPSAHGAGPILGTRVHSINLAEDHDEFQRIFAELGLRQAANGTATDRTTAGRIADYLSWGAPCSFAPATSSAGGRYIDKFLLDGTKIDVDAAGNQPSGRRLGVWGLNVQFGVVEKNVQVFEVNPPCVQNRPLRQQATGVPWAKVATAVMLGQSLRDVLWERELARYPRPLLTSIKLPVFPLPVPGRRRGARSGDAQHRGGDGELRRLWPRLRQGRIGRRDQAPSSGSALVMSSSTLLNTPRRKRR